MEMSINEAITWLNTDDYESKGFADATGIAIDTMRKYQKIVEIVADDYGYISNLRKIMDIKEAIEDGNDIHNR